MMKYNYVNIDSNQNISVIDDKGNKQQLDITNIYIDKNPFNMIIADPVNKTYYENRNIYFIEAGQIYVIGFAASLITKHGNKPTSINGWINFNDKARETGIYDVKSINKIKFNPNMFNQFQNGSFMLPEDMKLYNQTISSVLEYDRPNDELHKLFYIKGIRDALAFRPNHAEIDRLYTEFGLKHFYFSYVHYYTQGVRVGSLINIGEIKII